MVHPLLLCLFSVVLLVSAKFENADVLATQVCDNDVTKVVYTIRARIPENFERFTVKFSNGKKTLAKLVVQVDGSVYVAGKRGSHNLLAHLPFDRLLSGSDIKFKIDLSNAWRHNYHLYWGGNTKPFATFSSVNDLPTSIGVKGLEDYEETGKLVCANRKKVAVTSEISRSGEKLHLSRFDNIPSDVEKRYGGIPSDEERRYGGIPSDEERRYGGIPTVKGSIGSIPLGNEPFGRIPFDRNAPLPAIPAMKKGRVGGIPSYKSTHNTERFDGPNSKEWEKINIPEEYRREMARKLRRPSSYGSHGKKLTVRYFDTKGNYMGEEVDDGM